MKNKNLFQGYEIRHFAQNPKQRHRKCPMQTNQPSYKRVFES